MANLTKYGGINQTRSVLTLKSGVPSGYVVGRTSAGDGAAEFVKISGLSGVGVGSRSSLTLSGGTTTPSGASWDTSFVSASAFSFATITYPDDKTYHYENPVTQKSIRTAAALPSGVKIYCEQAFDQITNNNTSSGVCDAILANTDNAAISAHALANVAAFGYVDGNTGRTVGYAVDTGAQKLWFYGYVSGTPQWVGSGMGADPTTGTAGIDISALSGSIRYLFFCSLSNGSGSAGSGERSTLQSVPTTFTYSTVWATLQAAGWTAFGTSGGSAQYVIYIDNADNKLKALGPNGTVTVLATP